MKTRILGGVALVAVVAASVYALFGVPADLNQGDAQRVMYVHVPSAWLAYLSFGVTALAGLGWLWKRDLRFDWLAVAGAEIGVMFTAFTLWAGAMWGRPVWGVFYQWEDPRILSTTVLLALYSGYLLMRRMTDDPIRRANRAAVVGFIAALDIPIVHFSVEWWRGLHQGPTIGSPDRLFHPAAPGLFVLTLLSMLAAFTIAWAYLMIRRYQLAALEARTDEAARRGTLARARAAAEAGVPEVAPRAGEAAR
jgi:heme exporter protein C